MAASMEVMATDAERIRGERPFIFRDLKTGQICHHR
jgi:Ni2+-binding GTPase involved in maturation of urease and hydrogenase